MSMIDLSKVYENLAREITADLQSFIGVNMVATQIDKQTGKNKESRRNPNVGPGTLRLMSGKLFRSFSPKTSNTGNVYNLTISDSGFSLIYGSSVVYAKIHEFGGKAGRNGSATIPARPYFAPAIEDWKKQKYEATVLKVKRDVIQGVKVWLESQKSPRT